MTSLGTLGFFLWTKCHDITHYTSINAIQSSIKCDVNIKSAMFYVMADKKAFNLLKTFLVIIHQYSILPYLPIYMLKLINKDIQSSFQKCGARRGFYIL